MPTDPQIPASLASLKDKDVILCTDLDGTFLGGTKEERQRLYDFVEQNRDRIGLVFVTGRTQEGFAHLDPATPFDPKYSHDRDPHEGEVRLPTPDVLITSVGGRVADGTTQEVIPAVQRQMEGNWDEAWPKAQSLLSQTQGVSLFDEAGGGAHRVYHYDQHSMDRPIEEVARELEEKAGVNTVVSHGFILDVLPQGVDKATAIQRTLSAAGLSPKDINQKVLTAGDSMNDYEMLTHGYKAVMMGNAHDSLKAALPRTSRIHRSQETGAAAVQDGLETFFPHLKQRMDMGAPSSDQDAVAPKAAPTPAPALAPSPFRTLR